MKWQNLMPFQQKSFGLTLGTLADTQRRTTLMCHHVAPFYPQRVTPAPPSVLPSKAQEEPSPLPAPEPTACSKGDPCGV